MTVEFPDDIRAAIDAAVRSGRYPSAGDAIAAAWRSFEGHGEAATATASPATPQPPFWEVIEAENRAIPPEVWDALPADLSDQHDHYVYGIPQKRAESEDAPGATGSASNPCSRPVPDTGSRPNPWHPVDAR